MSTFTVIRDADDSSRFLVAGPDGLLVPEINDFLIALASRACSAYTLRTPLEWYYLALVLLLLAALASLRLARSRIGRAWAALSEDPTAAISSGVGVAHACVLAFGLGAAVAGMAGALFAGVSGYVDPGQSDFTISVMVLAMVVIGGAGSVPGAIAGALVVGGFDLFVIRLLGSSLEQLARTTGSPLLTAFDLRALSLGSFGAALYLTMLLRGRREQRSVASRPVRASQPVTSAS